MRKVSAAQFSRLVERAIWQWEVDIDSLVAATEGAWGELMWCCEHRPPLNRTTVAARNYLIISSLALRAIKARDRAILWYQEWLGLGKLDTG